MTELGIEDIVARFEKEGGIISLREIDALIASWRARGEALKEVLPLAIRNRVIDDGRIIERARTALGDKP